MLIDPHVLLDAMGSIRAGTHRGCPRCGTGLVKISADASNSDCRFTCDNSSCDFVGTYYEAAVKLLGAEQAMLAFAVGGIYRNAVTCLGDSEAIPGFLSRKENMRKARSWFAHCREHILTPGIRSRTVFSQLSELKICHHYDNTSLWHSRLVPNLGLVPKTETKTLPKAFERYLRKPYKDRDLVLFPYFSNGDAVGAAILDLSEPLISTTYVAVDDCASYAVFPEIHASLRPRTVVVAGSEIMACSIRRSVAELTGVKPCVVSTTGFPLPGALGDCNDIVLAETVSERLGLGRALLAFLRCENVTVMTLAKDCAIDSEKLKRINGDTKNTMPLRQWLVQALEKLKEDGNTNSIYEAAKYANVKTKDMARFSELISDSKDAAEIELAIERAAASEASNLTMGGGRVVIACDGCLVGLNPNGTQVKLSNFGLAVTGRLQTRSQEIRYRCTIATKSAKIGTEIGWEHLKDIYRLKRKLESVVADSGNTKDIPILHRNTGYNWDEIVQALGEGTPLYHEAERMGYNRVGNFFELPNARIVFDGLKVSRNTNPVQRSEEAARSYAGIMVPDRPEPVTTLRQILKDAETDDNIAGYVLGIGYVLAMARYDKLKLREKKRTNVIYLENADRRGEWSGTFSALSLTLSGDREPQVSLYRNCSSHMKKGLDELGNLPWLFDRGDVSIKAMCGVWGRLGVNTVSCDTESAVPELVTGHKVYGIKRSLNKIMEFDDYIKSCAAVADTTIEYFQYNIPAILAAVLEGPGSAREREDQRHPDPVYGYRLLCKVANAAPSPTLSNLVFDVGAKQERNCKLHGVTHLKLVKEA